MQEGFAPGVVATMGKKFFIIVCCLALMLAVGILAIAWYLPVYIEKRAIPQLLEQAGIDKINCPVRRVGLFGADLGPLRVGKKDRQPITVAAIQLDYSPLGLYRQRIRAVRLSGIDISGGVDQKGFQINGLGSNLIKTTSPNARPPEPQNKTLALPIHIGRMAVTHSALHLKWNRKTIAIPFSLIIYASEDKPLVYHSQLTATLLGNHVKINGPLDLDKGLLSLELSSAPLTIGSIVTFFDLHESVSGNAVARLKGELTAGLLPPRIQSMSVEVLFDRLNAGTDTIRLKSLPESGEFNKRPRLRIAQSGLNAWQMNLKHVHVTTPGNFALHLSALKASAVAIPKGDLQMTGQFDGTIPAIDENRLSAIASPTSIPLAIDFSGIRKSTGSWQIKATGPKVEAPILSLAIPALGVDMGLRNPDIFIEASGNRTTATGQVHIKIPTAKISTGEMVMDFQSIDVNGDFTLPHSDPYDHPRFKLSVATSQSHSAITIDPKLKPITLKAPKIKLLATGKTGTKHVDGTLSLSGLKIHAPAYDTKLSKMEATIPFQWPFPKRGKTGNVSIGSIRLGTWNLGKTTIRLNQSDSGFTFNGKHENPILPKLKIRLSGHARLPLSGIKTGVFIDIDALRTKDAGPIDLQPFIQAVEGLTANGDTRIKGNLHITNVGTKGEICLYLDNGDITDPEQNTAITGLQSRLCLPALPDFRSAPQQRLSFETINFGKIQLSKGTVDYQVESPTKIFIENGAFQWSSGTVRLSAMRVQTDKEDYTIRLDCDRLNLAEILAQFGVAQGEGSGTVNGTIPIRLQEGRLFFDDGFLYSTPGVGGKIRLTGTETLTVGIPEGSLQYHQIDLAREALKDFDYQWTKLGLKTENNELVMRLQFDGKPAKPLPFEFRKNFGGFKRVDADSRGSNFQGISLDVNFRLPLNDLMQYKDILQYLE